MKTKFAIIGCGRIAPYHARAIAAIDQAELVAVCDINPDKARDFAAQFDTECYTSYKELFKNEKIDIVSIAVPNDLHLEIAKYAAKMNVNIICEKPFSTNTKYAKELVSACKKAGVKLTCCFQNRFNTPVQEVKKIIEHKKLGKIYSVSIVLRWSRNHDYFKNWHGSLKESGGGALMVQAIHHLDLLIYFFGMPNAVIGKIKTLKYPVEVEDTFIGLFNYENGLMGTFEASTTVYSKDLEASVSINAEKGFIKIGGKSVNEIEYSLLDESVKLSQTVDIAKSVYGSNHIEVFKNFIDAVNNGKELMITPKDGLNAVYVIEQFYKSASLNKEVLLKHE